jgi:hypothetical protein
MSSSVTTVVHHRPVGEVGVDLDRVQVAGDEQRRVVERLAVELQLAVGAGQVLVRAFVLPHEAAAKEDVGVALLAFRLFGLRSQMRNRGRRDHIPAASGAPPARRHR